MASDAAWSPAVPSDPASPARAVPPPALVVAMKRPGLVMNVRPPKPIPTGDQSLPENRSPAADSDEEFDGLNTTIRVEPLLQDLREHRAALDERVAAAFESFEAVERDLQWQYLQRWYTAYVLDEAAAMQHVADLASWAPHGRNLVSLEFHKVALRGVHCHAIGRRLLPEARGLTNLQLTVCNLSTEDVFPLCVALQDGVAPGLCSLDLSHNRLDIVTCRVLEDVVAATGLEALSLRGNPFGDENSAALLQLLLKPPLKRLDIGYCKLSDTAIVKLCTVLQSRDVACTHINIDGVDMNQRVALLLLDTVCESRRLVGVSLKGILNCTAVAYQQRLQAALQRNSRMTKRAA